MPIIDFHNHYYPPAYLKALQDGESAVQVTIDKHGNPLLHYPGDYNIAVPGQRDLDVRVKMLDEHGIDMQVYTLTTPGTHVETPATAARLAALVNDEFARGIEQKRGRFTALATLPLNDPRKFVGCSRIWGARFRISRSAWIAGIAPSPSAARRSSADPASTSSSSTSIQ